MSEDELLESPIAMVNAPAKIALAMLVISICARFNLSASTTLNGVTTGTNYNIVGGVLGLMALCFGLAAAMLGGRAPNQHGTRIGIGVAIAVIALVRIGLAGVGW